MLLQRGRCCHRADRLAPRLRLHQHHACGPGGLNNRRGSAAISLHFRLSFTSAPLHGPQQLAVSTRPSPRLTIIRTSVLSREQRIHGCKELLWAVEGLDLTIPLHTSIPFSVTSMAALRIIHLTRKLLYLFPFKTNK